MTGPKASYEVVCGEQTRLINVSRAETEGEVTRYVLSIDGAEPVQVEVSRPAGGVMTLLRGGESYDVGVTEDEDGFEIDVRGYPHAVSVIDPRRKALRTAGGAGAGSVKAQMPGRVVRVLVAEGDSVEKGTPLLVVEAMKMENEIKSPRAGAVRSLPVGPGDLVEAKQVLVELAD